MQSTTKKKKCSVHGWRPGFLTEGFIRRDGLFKGRMKCYSGGIISGFVIHRRWFRSDHTSSVWFHLQNWGSFVSAPGQTTRSHSRPTQTSKGHESRECGVWSVCRQGFGKQYRRCAWRSTTPWRLRHCVSLLLVLTILSRAFVWFQAHDEVRGS